MKLIKAFVSQIMFFKPNEWVNRIYRGVQFAKLSGAVRAQSTRKFVNAHSIRYDAWWKHDGDKRDGPTSSFQRLIKKARCAGSATSFGWELIDICRAEQQDVL